MSDADALLEAGHRVYVVATGAGAGLQKMLWDVPGISSVLVGAELPYATRAVDSFLGYTPDAYCDRTTAIALALEAYAKAWSPDGAPAIGLGLTASVATTRVHRGDHRVFVATVSDVGVRLWSAAFDKGTGEDARRRDGDACDALGLAALLAVTGRRTSTALPLHTEEACDEEAMDVLLARPLFTARGERRAAPANGNGLTLFPGAFHPPHDGHFWMARENDATFHVTVDPPHKPHLSVAEVVQRAKLLEGFPRLFTRGDPLYLDKARRFPGARFLIGVDALERMLDPKWGVPSAQLVSDLRRLGIRFVVADRAVDGRVQTLDALDGAPLDLCERCLAPGDHLSMSSTQVRAAMASR